MPLELCTLERKQALMRLVYTLPPESTLPKRITCPQKSHLITLPFLSFLPSFPSIPITSNIALQCMIVLQKCTALHWYSKTCRCAAVAPKSHLKTRSTHSQYCTAMHNCPPKVQCTALHWYSTTCRCAAVVPKSGQKRLVRYGQKRNPHLGDTHTQTHTC